MITQELLDDLWDFGDPDGSERRFAAEGASPAHIDGERAELLTLQARALALVGPAVGTSPGGRGRDPACGQHRVVMPR